MGTAQAPRALPLQLGLTLSVAAALRFARLDAWPLFGDEDLYTWCTVEMGQLPLREALEFCGRTAALKPPLALALPLALETLVPDPVLAGRMVSAAAGVGTTALTFFLGRKLGTASTGLLAALLYALAPLAVLHERMVLNDGPMTVAALATLLLGWSAFERGSLGRAFWALALGTLAVQLKLGAWPLTLAPAILWLSSKSPRKPAAPALISSLGPAVGGLLLWLTPLGTFLESQAAERLALLKHLDGNLRDAADAAWTYSPGALLPFVALGFFFLFRSHPRLGAAMAALAAALVAPWLLLGNFAPSRYFLPVVPLLAALAALGITRGAAAARRERWLARVIPAVAVLTLAMCALASGRLVLEHETAAMSALDDWQYRSGWPSGYSIAAARDWLEEHLEPHASVAFAILPAHRIAARTLEAPAPGAHALGLFDLDDALRPLPSPERGPVYVVVDSAMGDAATLALRLQRVRTALPQATEVARFLNPGARVGTVILKATPSAPGGAD